MRPHRREPTRLPVPGILQARTLEGVAIPFSNAWKWKVKVKSLSRVRLLATPWTAAYQAPPTTGFSRQEYWSGLPLPSPTEAKLFCSQARSNLPNSLPHLNLYGLPVLSPSLFSIMQINLSGFCFFFLTFDWYLNSSLYREFRNWLSKQKFYIPAFLPFSSSLSLALSQFCTTKKCIEGLPWWLSGKELPANVGDVGSIPGPGRFHLPQSN